MSITAPMVKELREKTGAGMMDCKAALTETDGNLEAAVDWLRKKGISKAEKKAGRVAAEGLIGVASEGNKAAVVEVNSETDFVARNDNFQSIVSTIATVALDSGDIDSLSNAAFPNTSVTVSDHIKDAVGSIGENISLRRVDTLSVEKGSVASYMHNSVAEGLGKIGVLVAIESDCPGEKLNEFGRKIAMHIAASKPLALNMDDLDPAEVERERNVIADQARESGKPEQIIEKMVEGRLRKFYEEVILLKQAFVMDPDLTVEKAVEKFAGELGSPVKVAKFIRFELGDGIEKEESNFADEVAAATA